MYFCTLTVAAIADELRTTVLGGVVQRVVLPDTASIGLEVYAHKQRYQLLASAHPSYARVHLVGGKLSRGVEQASPLLLLLRKYVLGGRIMAIEQPPLERVLTLSIVKEVETCNLIVECMDRRSNIMLVDEHAVILDSVKRVTSRMSHRVILPHVAYMLPPAQDKYDPRVATVDELLMLCEQDKRELVRVLVAGYRGVSPQTAREVLYRAGLGAFLADKGSRHAFLELQALDAVAQHLRDLFTARCVPVVVPGEAQPVAYAPYRLTYMAGAVEQPTMSVALEVFYQVHQQVTNHGQRRDAVREQLDAARKRLHNLYDLLVKEREKTLDAEQVRWEGEMILGFMHAIAPGQCVLEVEGQSIALDPACSPLENAQRRFVAYGKAKSGAESVAKRLRDVELQWAGLEELAALLELADEREQIEQIALEAEEQGFVVGAKAAYAKTKPKLHEKPGKQCRPALRKPLHVVSSEGFDMYVGRSSQQNAYVTFRVGRPDDMWLHARGVPGAHVIVRSGKQSVPEQTLREAAGLAAYFSRARAEKAVDVDVARRTHVRKVSGGPPGLVTCRVERTLRVEPLPPYCWSAESLEG